MDSKISSLAFFDDLMRCYRVVGECSFDYEDNRKLLNTLEDYRRKLCDNESEFQKFKESNKRLHAEKNALEANLIHARNAIENEMKKRIAAEQERDVLENQVAIIRELLANDPNGLNDRTKEKLAFLQTSYNMNSRHESNRRLDTINESSGSILSSEDISYDRTDDNIDESCNRTGQQRRISGRLSISEGKRRSSAPLIKDLTPPKKSKISKSIESGVTDAFDKSSEKRRTSESRPGLSELSTNVYADKDRLTGGKENKCGNDNNKLKSYSTPEVNTRRTPNQKCLSGSKLGNRRHEFCSKTIIKPETCTPCGKKISFGKSAYRCKDCRAVCHLECRDKVPLPCVPVVFTPSSKGVTGYISDYAPLTSPMIPAIVIHCVNEIESRGLSEVGIYRVPGSEREIKDLKEKFLRGRGVPNLSRIDDIHAVCGCVKDFLRSLKEPIIMNSKWHDFVNAAESSDLNPMYDAIAQLPQPNCDTLAFMIIHLQKVADSPACKMPASNLAKIFGPTIVGYSSLDPEPAAMLAETKKQASVMERLLSISFDYWKTIVDVDRNSLEPDQYIIDERRHSSNKGKQITTPLGSRDTLRRLKSQRKSMTFSSPMVKGANY